MKVLKYVQVTLDETFHHQYREVMGINRASKEFVKVVRVPQKKGLAPHVNLHISP